MKCFFISCFCFVHFNNSQASHTIQKSVLCSGTAITCLFKKKQATSFCLDISQQAILVAHLDTYVINEKFVAVNVSVVKLRFKVQDSSNGKKIATQQKHATNF